MPSSSSSDKSYNFRTAPNSEVLSNVASHPSAPLAPSGASTPLAESDWCVKSQVITEATITIKTTAMIPVSLEVGFKNNLADLATF